MYIHTFFVNIEVKFQQKYSKTEYHIHCIHKDMATYYDTTIIMQNNTLFFRGIIDMPILINITYLDNFTNQ